MAGHNPFSQKSPKNFVSGDCEYIVMFASPPSKKTYRHLLTSAVTVFVFFAATARACVISANFWRHTHGFLFHGRT